MQRKSHLKNCTKSLYVSGLLTKVHSSLHIVRKCVHLNQRETSEGYRQWKTSNLPKAKQCSGSGSVGTICFWASWIRIRISNLYVRIRILPPTSKKFKKNLDFYCLWLLNDFLSLKNDVNVPSERNKHKNLREKKLFLLAKRSWSGAGSTSGFASAAGSFS